MLTSYLRTHSLSITFIIQNISPRGIVNAHPGKYNTMYLLKPPLQENANWQDIPKGVRGVSASVVLGYYIRCRYRQESN